MSDNTDLPETIAQKLGELPPELVDPILDQLPFCTFLQLVWSQDKNVLRHLKSSPKWKHLLKSGPDWMVRYYDLCLCIHYMWTKDTFRPASTPFSVLIKRFGAPLTSLLTADVGKTRNNIREDSTGTNYRWEDRFRSSVRDRLRICLAQLPTTDLELSKLVDAGPISGNARLLPQEAVTLLWREIRTQNIEDEALRRQINLYADLLKQHPTRLKLLQDESEAPRSNVTHLYNAIRIGESRITKATIFNTKHRYAYLKTRGCVVLPILVPYRRYFDLFLNGLASHPPPDLQVSGFDRIREHSSTDGKPSENIELPLVLYKVRAELFGFCACACHPSAFLDLGVPPIPHKYPPDILEAIELASKGFIETYAEWYDEKPRKLKCCSAVLLQKSAIECDDYHGWHSSPAEWDWYAPRRYPGPGDINRPMSGREIKWLEGFLNVVKYLENTFPDLREELEADAKRCVESQRISNKGDSRCNDRGERVRNRHGKARGVWKPHYVYTLVQPVDEVKLPIR